MLAPRCSPQVSFHDTTQYRHRVPLLTDYYGFTLGALGPRAVLYAAPAGADTPAVVVCRQFESWTSNSDWTVALPEGEAPVALAIGGYKGGIHLVV
jgi:chromosome transmission fidelity protein 4